MVYPCSGVRLSSSVDHFQRFSPETAWPIKAEFHVEPLWEEGTKVHINGSGHMTKMAATLYLVKKPLKIFSRTKSPVILKLCMQHWVLQLYKVYINDDHSRPWLTLTYFTAMSNLVAYTFECEKLLVISWEKLATNDQINRKKLTPRVVCPCPGAIYMYVTVIFKHAV